MKVANLISITLYGEEFSFDSNQGCKQPGKYLTCLYDKRTHGNWYIWQEGNAMPKNLNAEKSSWLKDSWCISVDTEAATNYKSRALSRGAYMLSRSKSFSKPKVCTTVNERFGTVLEYRIFWLDIKALRYDKQVPKYLQRWVSWLPPQVQPKILILRKHSNIRISAGILREVV